MAKTARTPWKRSNPRKRAGTAPKHLSPAQKSAAKARARRAGRRYPNLVDNMRMAAENTTKAKSARKKTSKKKSAKKQSAKTTRKTTARKTAKKRKRSAARRRRIRAAV